MNRFYPALILAVLAIPAFAADWPAGFSVPASTLSPDHKYGVLVPDADHYDENHPQNKLVEVATHRVLAVINAETGMEQMNHGGTEPQWSEDGKLLLWKVDGKWFPRALVLLKIEKGAVAWQTNILKSAQEAILSRTKTAHPKAYAVAKDFNKGNGSAYPDGFTVNVTTPVDDGKPVAVPMTIASDLTPDPKGAEGFPKAGWVKADLEATVGADGKFTVGKFSSKH